MQKGLHFKEWLSVCLLLFLSVFFLISNWGIYTLKLQKVRERSFFEKPVIQVSITGAVCSPGVYEVEAGTSLKSVLGKARPMKEADKQFLYTKKTLLTSCSVHVPEKTCKKREKRKG